MLGAIDALGANDAARLPLREGAVVDMEGLSMTFSFGFTDGAMVLLNRVGSEVTDGVVV